MIVNAKITSTMLGIEDHGIMTFFIFIELNNSNSWSLGGYALDCHVSKNTPRGGSAIGYQVIRQILETVGVDRWEKLPGTLIRINDMIDINNTDNRLTCIGHIMENRWFNLTDWMKQENQGDH